MPDPAPVNITTRSGHVRVVASEGAELSVDGGTIGLVDDGSIRIRRAPSASTIEVQCAPGTDVTVGTVSGKVDLLGALGTVRVATVSGRIRVLEADRIDVRTKSGKIEIGTCAGACRIMTKSSSVHVGSADRATVAAVSGIVLLERVRGADVKTVSGKVLIGSSGGERVSVHTVSGKVEIRVPAATNPSTRLRSLSGHVQCDLVAGNDFEIAVSSVSGAIRLSSA
ncbi:MAG TPA: DUF4097 family beta strand repeat-containing protein [Acidimicrobiia bacterium]|jgi:hypothetical protein|nr:DUF4097 family beta strand repeat-containing protein [Acidimicrobiia bacterium]